ncbi:MAG: hypothetical protein C0518_07065 [Opitutus sp.]|nr:hypothetical protein [Opitutus sp.]
MKKTSTTPAGRIRTALAIGLATLLTISVSGQGTDSDALRRLQEENAALRKRLAEIEGQSTIPAPTTAPAQAPAPAATGPVVVQTVQPASDPEVVTLSPFQVKTDRDYGYLKTNSATATRIGTEIQKVPLSISVLSEEFIKDTQMTDIQDVLRYQSSAAGDNRMGLLQPATGFTPSGNMSLRGFPINSRLRNGLTRYNGYNLDNVDRVEIIKGPASVFFGNAFPGGVINYVTKKPEFRNLPTTINYSYNAYDNRMGGQRVTLDHNHMASEKAAFRVTGAWDNGKGDRRFEYNDGFSVNAGVTLNPLKSGKLQINVEGEVLQRMRNQDDDSWRYPTQWFQDYQTPPTALIAAAGLSGNADPAAAYRARILTNIGAWIADRRTAANDQSIALWTQPLEHGAYITDRAGNRVHDEKFNYYGSGSYSKDDNSTFAVTTDYAVADWLDVRHSFTRVQSRFDRLFSVASPYADGIRWNTSGVTYQGYQIDASYNQLDMVAKKELFGVDNKLLFGGFHSETYNSFYGSQGHAGIFPFYGYLPGAYDKPDEGYVSPIPANMRHPVTGWGYPTQFVRDRNGRIITPQQIFSEYDPAVHPFPDIRRIAEVTRGLVDHSRPTREEWYINWQGTALKDRLVGFLGYREEKVSTVGQLVKVNSPWYEVPDFALEAIPPASWTTYGLSPIFSRPRNIKGSAKMAGASFEILPNVNVYASFSETFIPPGPEFLGGDYDPNAVTARAVALGLNGATENARLVTQGGLTGIQNEKGRNAEVGVKVSLWDNKLVATASVFQVTRQNRTLDDTQRQFEEPLNWTGPGNTGTFNRIVRWYTASAKQQTEGLEFEAIWTPMRNYQAVVSGAWMWDAKTLADPTLVILPNSSAATRALSQIVFSQRLPYAPEYRLNVFQKYTFTDDIFGTIGRGASVGLGTRYSSEIIISNDQNFNSDRGGITAGDYVVFDTFVAYPFEVFGYKMTGTLNVANLTDKKYSEGGYNLAQPRSFTFSLGMKF